MVQRMFTLIITCQRPFWLISLMQWSMGPWLRDPYILDASEWSVKPGRQNVMSSFNTTSIFLFIRPHRGQHDILEEAFHLWIISARPPSHSGYRNIKCICYINAGNQSFHPCLWDLRLSRCFKHKPTKNWLCVQQVKPVHTLNKTPLLATHACSVND